jgi:hypothetical protein
MSASYNIERCAADLEPVDGTCPFAAVVFMLLLSLDAAPPFEPPAAFAEFDEYVPPLSVEFAGPPSLSARPMRPPCTGTLPGSNSMGRAVVDRS